MYSSHLLTHITLIAACWLAAYCLTLSIYWLRSLNSKEKKVVPAYKLLCIATVISTVPAFCVYEVIFLVEGEARRVSCASNLRGIGCALKQYAMDFTDYFPDKRNDGGFELLRSNDYLTDYKIYVCPSTNDINKLSFTTAQSSYCYPGNMSEADSADSPLAWDKCRNHGNHVNILFLDGHVTGYPSEQADKILPKGWRGK